MPIVEVVDIEPDEIEELPQAVEVRALEPVSRNLPAEARVAGVAAAGGIVAGAAAFAAVKIVRRRNGKKPAHGASRRGKREPQAEPLLSRSFLVDVHLLK